MLDISTLQFATYEQFVNISHEYISQPALIILFVTMLLSMIISALVVNSNQKEWNNFWKIFGFTLLLGTIFFCLVFFLPQLTQKISEWFMLFFVGN